MASASLPSGVSRMKSASSVCMRRYTFPVKAILWLSVIGSIGGIAFLFWKASQRIAAKRQAAEQRMVEFMVQAKPAVAPAVAPVVAAPSEVPTQKLLFDAAGK